MSMFKISTRMQVVSKVYSPYRLFVSGKEEPLNHKNKQIINKQRFIIKVHDNTSNDSSPSTLFSKVPLRLTRKIILIVLT